jgi:hypothetical protein
MAVLTVPYHEYLLGPDYLFRQQYELKERAAIIVLEQRTPVGMQ